MRPDVIVISTKGGLPVVRSGRPIYAIILFALASLWMCATFLPLLYSAAFPNRDIQEVVHALEERGTAPQEAASVVAETIAAAGPLTRAVPIAYYSGRTTTLQVGGSRTIRKKQASFLAWFQKRSKGSIVLITVHEDDEGRKNYDIDEGEAMWYVRGYALPLLLFGVSLFSLRKRVSRG